MRDLKLAVETNWSITRKEWDVAIWLIVAPGARYPVASFATTAADPMVEVADRFSGMFA